MSALPILAAVTALQAVTQTGAPATPPPDAAATPTGNQRKVGESDYIDAEAGLGYGTNPLLQFGSDTGQAFGRFSLHAVHARVSERSTTLISAYAQDSTYFGRYGSQLSFSVDARHDTAVNEHLSIFIDANAGLDKGGQLDTQIVAVPEVPPLPGSTGLPPPLLGPAGDFLSITGRTYHVGADAGATFALTPRDSLSITGGANHVSFRGFENTDYTTIPLSVAYNREISPRTTVGARLAFETTDYSGPAHFYLITPEVTAQLQLSERVRFAGAIGASFSTVNDGIGTRHSTGLAADASLCRLGEFSSLCATFSSNEETATVAGPARSLSGGLEYTRTLNPDSSLSLSAGVDRYASPVSVITGHSFSSSTYYRLAGEYSRRIGGRLFGGLNVAARKVTQSGPDPDSDLSASIFIRYRFGDIR